MKFNVNKITIRIVASVLMFFSLLFMVNRESTGLLLLGLTNAAFVLLFIIFIKDLKKWSIIPWVLLLVLFVSYFLNTLSFYLEYLAEIPVFLEFLFHIEVVISYGLVGLYYYFVFKNKDSEPKFNRILFFSGSILLGIEVLTMVIHFGSFSGIFYDPFAVLFQMILFFLVNATPILLVILYSYHPLPASNESHPISAQNKSIFMKVFLSIITFGIYGYIWVHDINKQLKAIANDGTNLTISILSYIFLPLYPIYWVYKRGQQIRFVSKEDGRMLSDDHLGIKILLSLFGFGILSLAMLQWEINSLKSE